MSLISEALAKEWNVKLPQPEKMALRNSKETDPYMFYEEKKEETSGFLSYIFIIWNWLNNRDNFLIKILIPILILDFCLSLLIVFKVSYTEIDWIAYMQEVGGVLEGNYNYATLQGNTGPLVYPAGFVYIYSGLYYLTEHGSNIFIAQLVFVALYSLCSALAACVLFASQIVPTYAILLIVLSKRVHSLFMLRCFNDCFATIFVLVAILFMIRNSWMRGCFFFSLAVSVKMNILLFAPALLVLLWMRFGIIRSIPHFACMFFTQIILAIPFITTYPKEYLRGAFNLGRVFDYTWTVNWRMLGQDIFLSKWFALGLIVSQLTFLFLFLNRAFPRGGLLQLVQSAWFYNYTLNTNNPPISVTKNETVSVPGSHQHSPYNHLLDRNISATRIVTLMFVSNFIGVVFARSLHYQFYVWYFHSLPLLLFLTAMHPVLKILFFFIIEYCWNVFPSTNTSSSLLLFIHLSILVGIYFSPTLSQTPLWEGHDVCKCVVDDVNKKDN